MKPLIVMMKITEIARELRQSEETGSPGSLSSANVMIIYDSMKEIVRFLKFQQSKNI